MKIILRRDSVCAADDCEAPHFLEFDYDKTQTLRALLCHIGSLSYLPHVVGRRHKWQVMIGSELVGEFKGNHKRPVFNTTLYQPLDNYTDNEELEIYFRYISARY